MYRSGGHSLMQQTLHGHSLLTNKERARHGKFIWEQDSNSSTPLRCSTSSCKTCHEVGGRGRRPLNTTRVFSFKIGVEMSKIVVTCMVLKANDRRKNIALGHNEYHGPRSGLC
ncbi:hypothetical protein TNCV_4506421 [Trichonephila clavipes]|nr:hypothetical protein TNCV_4506421 [Trichonephila clavipes]